MILLCLFNYTSFPSIPPVILPRLDPTSTPSVLSPESAPPPCKINRQGNRPPYLLCLSAASWCTIRWCEAPWRPLPHLPLGTPTIRLTRFFGIYVICRAAQRWNFVRSCTLCLLIDCCSADFGITVNKYARLLNAALWV